MTTGTASSEGIKLTSAQQKALQTAFDTALDTPFYEIEDAIVKWAFARFTEYLTSGDERSFLRNLDELKQQCIDAIGLSSETTAVMARNPDLNEPHHVILGIRREARAHQELLAVMEAHFGLRPSPAVMEEWRKR